jgi:hypothetical protein
MSRVPDGYAHKLRVRLGTPSGPRGVLYQCEARDGHTFWKVRLDDGSWAWPDRLLVDGPGDAIGLSCASCRLPYIMPAGSGELLCRRCSDSAFGSDAERASDSPSRRRWNDADHHVRWKPSRGR